MGILRTAAMPRGSGGAGVVAAESRISSASCADSSVAGEEEFMGGVSMIFELGSGWEALFLFSMQCFSRSVQAGARGMFHGFFLWRE